ncbi:LacI family transcriptional regulator [Streptomyces sp. NBC_01387]|uniref:LacI family DNA-binding transcriptional regulator n=1 Tax=Streptomyces sp. NBC_01387 TaxID=2903849 RepID=UPI003245CE0A
MAERAGRAPTLADVARVAGTSTAVVSYVMNNGPRPVAAKTRERVLAAAAELDYRPNLIARALRSRTTGVVGLILPEASNPYFGALARHVEQALDTRGKLTLIGNAGYSPERQEHLVDKFLAAQVDGLIIVSADGGTQVTRAGVPAVYVHNRPVDGQAPVVAAVNEAAVQEAITHLHGHGHTRIAFLSGPCDAGPVGERHAAWAALAGTAAPLLRCAYYRAAAAALTGQLIGEGAMPAALITATDEQAIGVLAGARAHGLAVPERLAVISLDGTPDSAFTAPALTVTQQPLEVMAAQAVDLLLDGETAVLSAPAPLIVRASCGCDPAA